MSDDEEQPPETAPRPEADPEPPPQEPEPPPPPGAHVVSLESRLRAGAKPRLTVVRETFCYAHHFDLCRETRLARCTKCKRAFSAFEALVYLAEHWGDFYDNRKAIRHELEKLRAERDALQAEVSALRSKTRKRLRAVAEAASPHATRALELLLRMARGVDRGNARVELHHLVREVQKEADVVPITEGMPQ